MVCFPTVVAKILNHHFDERLLTFSLELAHETMSGHETYRGYSFHPEFIRRNNFLL